MRQSNSAPYKVCLMGAALDTGNKGVSALCASFVKIMKEVKPEAEIALFIGNRTSVPQKLNLADQEVSLRVVNHRLSPRSKLKEHLGWIFFLACLQKVIPIAYIRKKIIQRNPFLKEMVDSDFVGDIRGGDSFSDIYGKMDLAFASLSVIAAILIGKKLILLPQTYGPFDSRLSRSIARFIISRAACVCSRDRAGIDYVRELMGDRINQDSLVFCPDVAFKLDSIKPENIDIQPPLEEGSNKPLIGINVNGLMYHGGYTQDNMFGLKIDYKALIVNLVKKILKDTDARILMVPHTFGPSGNVNSDPDASNKVIDALDGSLKTRVHMLNREYDQSQLKGVISLCDFFIGSRMHSCIAALSQGIPTIGIAYSKKFIGVFDSIDSGDTVLDARSLDEETIIVKILDCFEKRHQLSIDAKEKVAEAQARIKSVFQKLVAL